MFVCFVYGYVYGLKCCYVPNCLLFNAILLLDYCTCFLVSFWFSLYVYAIILHVMLFRMSCSSVVVGCLMIAHTLVRV